MAAAQGHCGDGPENPIGDEEGVPRAFQRAVRVLRGARVRAEVALEEIPAPRRLAPHAFALQATVSAEDGGELAEGRLVLLHAPDGREAWHGTFRLVTLVRTELEPEMAADPLLPEVCWSWLTGALRGRGAGYAEPSGTVSRCTSHHFGGLAERADSTEIEVRASWTPDETAGERAGGGPGPGLDAAAHLAAWCDLLCACAGLPPAPGDQGWSGVVSLPNRRGPR